MGGSPVEWVAISSSNGPHFVRTLHYDSSILCSPAGHGSQLHWVTQAPLPWQGCKFDLGVQNKAGQRLTEFCQENTLIITITHYQKHKRQLYTWTSPESQYPKPDWLCSLQPKMEKLYTVSKNKTWSWLWLWSWVVYCKFKHKLKKVKKNQ